MGFFELIFEFIKSCFPGASFLESIRRAKNYFKEKHGRN